MNPKDTRLYDLLELSPEATPDEIRKAYKRLAIKYHPDKNPDSGEHFKEVKAAYDILSDPEKRDIYDKYGEEGLQEGLGDDSMNDILSHIFGHSFGGGRGRGGKQRQRRGEDVNHPLEVTLEDLYNGKTTKIAIRKSVLCGDCKGKGTKSGNAQKCNSCGGNGVKIGLRQFGPGLIQQVQMQCGECDGTGEIIKEKDKCKTCKAGKIVEERKVLDIYIDKGMAHKQKITFTGEGDQMPDVIPGDIHLILQQKPHPVFKRNKDDLYMEKEITLHEALCGFKLHITHLDNRVLSIPSQPGQIIRPGEVLSIKKEGMPHYRDPFEKGDLIINFSIKFPTPDQLTPAHLQTLRSVLPAPAPLSPAENTEDAVLEKTSSQKTTTSSSYANANSQSNGVEDGEAAEDDEEEDEEGGRPRGVPCTQQ